MQDFNTREPQNFEPLPEEPMTPQKVLLELAYLLVLILFCNAMASLVLLLIGQVFNVEINSLLKGLNEESSASERNAVRSVFLINHFFTFISAAIFYTWSRKRQLDWREVLNLHKKIDPSQAVMGVFLLLISFPLIQYSYFVNKLIPLPDWMLQQEDSTTGLINGLLKTDHIYELIFNVLVIAIVPAIGEEMLFRGVLQPLVSKSSKSPIAAIWITAVIFSAFHLQFQGFLPRMLLGAFLGYLYFWTKNLWIPIIAHFANNGIQVILQYFLQKDVTETELDSSLATKLLPIALISAFAVFQTAKWFEKRKSEEGY